MNLIFLVIFLLCFIIASGLLYFYAKRALKSLRLFRNQSIYCTTFIRGNARGSVGEFASNSDVEIMRKEVNRKGSRF